MLASSDVYAILAEIFSDVFMRDDLTLTPELSAGDVPGWDSIKMIEIILATEERFSVRLTTRELDNLHSVGDLASVILGKAS